MAVNSLRPVKEIFDEFGIEFWLDYGTLLGAIRDGKIIEWDHDIDLSMWSHDRKKLFLALHELKRRKFKVTSGKPLYPSVKYVSLRFSPGSQMDIFLWQATQSKFISIMPWSTRDSRARGLAGGFWFALRLLRHYLSIDLELWRLSTKFRAIANILEPR